MWLKSRQPGSCQPERQKGLSEVCDKFHHFCKGPAENDFIGDLFQGDLDQLAGDDQGKSGDLLSQLGEEFFEVKTAGDAGEMGVEVIGFLEFAHELYVFERYIRPQV